MSDRIDAHFVAAGKYHDIDFARLEVLKLLAEHPQIRTTVACDYSDVERLEACRFLITYTCDMMPTEAEAKAIRSWLERGGKWLALHGTNSILVFTESGKVDTPDLRPDVMEMLGTQFKAHPPIGQFKVEVVNHDHELTRGIEDFEVIDELYLSNTSAEIDTLMQTRFEGEATGFMAEQWEPTAVPIVYTRAIGEGMVSYNALGHCRGHYDLPGMVDFYPNPERCSWNYGVYYELLRRGISWAMREGL
ncbi:ThuA domain-containing protein [Novosphingobium tardum]|uniref:ThuA domain-containing protein n=1 Tax=Novosphingobium tardum TaxID=1538021 RepID=A0ABV8RQF4_9SPHN